VLPYGKHLPDIPQRGYTCNSFRINRFRTVKPRFVAPRLHLMGSRGSRALRTSKGNQEDNVAKEDRGFASMDRAKQREIASKGGKAAHQKGTAHEWTSEEARDAGRKGGIASHRRRREQQGGSTGNDEVTGRGMDQGQTKPAMDQSNREDL
jgi:general stress protein YciG